MLTYGSMALSTEHVYLLMIYWKRTTDYTDTVSTP